MTYRYCTLVCAVSVPVRGAAMYGQHTFVLENGRRKRMVTYIGTSWKELYMIPMLMETTGTRRGNGNGSGP